MLCIERGRPRYMHCSRKHARSCTCRDTCLRIRPCFKYIFMYMKLGLQRRISACRTACSTKDPAARYRCMSLPLHMHCDCTAARLPCVFTLLKIQASIHVHVHELYSAEYRCMVKVCVPCVGQRRVYMSCTCISPKLMTRTRANSHHSFVGLSKKHRKIRV